MGGGPSSFHFIPCTEHHHKITLQFGFGGPLLGFAIPHCAQTHSMLRDAAVSNVSWCADSVNVESCSCAWGGLCLVDPFNVQSCSCALGRSLPGLVTSQCARSIPSTKLQLHEGDTCCLQVACGINNDLLSQPSWLDYGRADALMIRRPSNQEGQVCSCSILPTN